MRPRIHSGLEAGDKEEDPARETGWEELWRKEEVQEGRESGIITVLPAVHMVMWKSRGRFHSLFKTLLFLPAATLVGLSLWDESSSFSTDLKLGYVTSCGQWTVSRSGELLTKQKLSNPLHALHCTLPSGSRSQLGLTALAQTQRKKMWRAGLYPIFRVGEK